MWEQAWIEVIGIDAIQTPLLGGHFPHFSEPECELARTRWSHKAFTAGPKGPTYFLPKCYFNSRLI